MAVVACCCVSVSASLCAHRYLACVHRRPQCVRYLLEEGARVDIADKKGRTPLEYTTGMESAFVTRTNLFVVRNNAENDYFELTQLIEERAKAASSEKK
jgi:ankyrin repeat protein